MPKKKSIVKGSNKINKKNKFLILLIAVIFLGSFLRLYDINRESFWLDEGATALTIKKYNLPEILRNIHQESQILPEYYQQVGDLPIYYFSLEIWSMLFGINELSLRSFSALFGILSIISVFYLVNLLFNKKIALLSTFFSAINLTLITYSQESRVYAFVLFFSLLSIIFLVKYLKEEKTIYLTGFIISNIIILCSQFSWLIFVFAEGLYILFVLYKKYRTEMKLDKKLFIALLILGIVSMPLITKAFSLDYDVEKVYGRPDIKRITQFGVQLSTYVPAKEDILNKPLLTLSVALISMITFILFLIGIKNFRKHTVLLAFMFFVPIAIVLLTSFVYPKFSLFQIRQLIYVIPIYLIFVSLGCFKIKYRNIVVILIVILSIFPIYYYYTETQKQEFREVAEVLPKKDIIFTNIHTAQVTLKYYYGESDNIIGIKNINELKPHLEGIDSFWVLFTHTKYSDPDGKIRNYIDSNYILLEKKQFHEIELLHYEKAKV
jgi:uncharacterized membrane protein